MARLDLTVQKMLGPYPTLPISANGIDVIFTAAGATFVDGAAFPITGKEVLLVWNKNAGPQTLTINSIADPETKRTGDITAYSIGAAEIAYFGPVYPKGWQQADGKLYFATTAADVWFAVLRLP